MRYIPRISSGQWLALALFIFPILVMSALSQSNNDESSIVIWNQEIPMRESQRQPVIGIDIEEMLDAHVENLKAYRNMVYVHDSVGLISNWRSEGEAKSSEKTVGIGLIIGVHPSHRAALEAAKERFESLSVLFQLVTPDENELGYIAWIPPGNLTRAFVRDNVFVQITCRDMDKLDSLAKVIDLAIKNDGAGVYKGNKVIQPEVREANFPSELVADTGGKVCAVLNANDPGGRQLYRGLQSFIVNPAPPVEGLIQIGPPQPNIKWNNDGIVEFQMKNGRFDLMIRAVVINDRCVVSEKWEKEVIVRAAGE